MLHDTCDDGQLLLQCFRDAHTEREREKFIQILLYFQSNKYLQLL